MKNYKYLINFITNYKYETNAYSFFYFIIFSVNIFVSI